MKKIEALGICSDCITNENNIGRTEEFLMVYCPHNQTGAFMLMANGKSLHGHWRMISPVTFDEFKKIVHDAVLMHEWQKKLMNMLLQNEIKSDVFWN